MAVTYSTHSALNNSANWTQTYLNLVTLNPRKPGCSLKAAVNCKIIFEKAWVNEMYIWYDSWSLNGFKIIIEKIHSSTNFLIHYTFKPPCSVLGKLNVLFSILYPPPKVYNLCSWNVIHSEYTYIWYDGLIHLLEMCWPWVGQSFTPIEKHQSYTEDCTFNCRK